MNKLKDFVLNHKFLSALLVLDLISFIISFIIGIFISAIGTLFFFLIFITATYLIVIFEKHALKIFIIGIVLLIIPFIDVFSLLILPQSFLLLILKHIKIFDKQNAIIKTIIIDAIILITFFMLFGFATLLLEMQKI